MPGPALTHSQKIRRLVIIGSLLLAALLSIIALVWWSDHRQSRNAGLNPVTGQSLRIERPGFAAITLRKQADEQWRVMEPCELTVNSQRLRPLLDALAPASHSYASTEVDLEAAGLINPEAVLFLDEQRLALGGTDLSGERRYLQRGDRVEFVPEWLLSMLNGGLSAIAALEVFPEGLDALDAAPSRPDNSELPTLAPESLALWKSLTAQQIVSWPLADTDPAVGSRPLMADIAGHAVSLTLHDYQRFVALRFENDACAYIMARTSLPDSVFP